MAGLPAALPLTALGGGAAAAPGAVGRAGLAGLGLALAALHRGLGRPAQYRPGRLAARDRPLPAGGPGLDAAAAGGPGRRRALAGGPGLLQRRQLVGLAGGRLGGPLAGGG